MTKNEQIANEIADVVDYALERHHLYIVCEDENEEKERRYAEGNEAKIYGSEWADLTESIEYMLPDYLAVKDSVYAFLIAHQVRVPDFFTNKELREIKNLVSAAKERGNPDEISE